MAQDLFWGQMRGFVYVSAEKGSSAHVAHHLLQYLGMPLTKIVPVQTYFDRRLLKIRPAESLYTKIGPDYILINNFQKLRIKFKTLEGKTVNFSLKMIKRTELLTLLTPNNNLLVMWEVLGLYFTSKCSPLLCTYIKEISPGKGVVQAQST